MPNEEHLALLRQGVDIWNQWRKENPEVKPDLRELKLGKAILTSADLSGSDLRGADLRKSDFSKLPSGNIGMAKLVGSDPPQFSKFDYPFADVDLCGADFREADLRNANLSEADLRGANLNNANLSEVDLRGVGFYEATIIGINLSKAKLGKANLSKVHFSNINFCQADIKEGNLSGAFLCQSDFSGADLSGSDLSEANLSLAKLHKANLAGANLVGAYLADAVLSEANLNDADLSLTRALGTDFTGAQLTGACLEDWSYNSNTKLNSVICDYVYLKKEQQERRPHSGNFASGEFAKLFDKALETVDLIFQGDINWGAFAYSFKNIEIENSDAQLDIQSIEKKGDGVLSVKVSVSANANKAKIHSEFMQGYELASKVVETHYEARLQDKDKHINQLVQLLQQSNEKLGEVPRLMAEVPKYDQRYSNFGNFVDTAESGSNQQSIQHNYAPAQSQMLAEAAKDIYQLVTQRETQGYSLEEAQNQVATDLAKQAQNDSTMKEKLIELRHYLSDAAANGIIGEIAVMVVKSVLNLVGLPVP